jgi:hypothetical protein
VTANIFTKQEYTKKYAASGRIRWAAGKPMPTKIVRSSHIRIILARIAYIYHILNDAAMIAYILKAIIWVLQKVLIIFK